MERHLDFSAPGHHHDRQRVERLVHATGGSPLAISWAADLSGRSGVFDLDAVGAEIVDRLAEALLKTLSQAQQELMQAACVPRALNADLLEHLTGNATAGAELDVISRFPFVRWTRDALVIHEQARAVIGEALRKRSPRRRSDLHRSCVEYYVKERQAVDRATALGSAQYRSLTSELVFHRLHVSSRTELIV
jgi:ATP/maltotriose-dependent transcriptional regulator MalT